MDLETIGWGPTLAFYLDELGESSLVPARLATVDRGRAVGLTSGGPVQIAWNGPVPLLGEPDHVIPAVGDWVALAGKGELRSLKTLLPRSSLLSRGHAEGARVSQPLAANVDVVLVVTGLDGDFSLRRIERYLALARSGDASAVVVLSKADLVEAPAAAIEKAEQAAIGLTVLAVSALTGTGLEAVMAEIGPGRTAVLLGSSGAGKSTLINSLLGEDRQRTGAVRKSDDRGRHVTTRRELLELPTGGLVIDTPGLRAVGLIADTDALLSVFPEISELAEQCRFNDCTHTGEPGCAVTAAVEAGNLDPDRLASFHKLITEQQSAALRSDEHARRTQERATIGKYRQRLREANLLKGREE